MKMTNFFIGSMLLVSTSFAQTGETTSPPTSPPLPASEAVKPSSPPEPAKPAAIPKVSNGQELHDGKCLSCHKPGFYTRESRRIKSYDSLKTQVQTCATNLSIPWFEDEVEEVANYVNTEYYKFEKKMAK
jgi:mono/diheme cytochrome c family protein